VKLSLLEVEETISLSNLIKQNKKKADTYKVIAIKEIDRSEENEENISYRNDEDEFASLLDKISVAKEELAQLEVQKEQALADIKETIAKEKEAWNEEKEKARQEAQEDGFQKGFEAGKRESVEQHDTLIEKANQIYLASVEDYHSTVKKHTKTIIQLAIKTSKKIIENSFEENPENFALIVNKAIDELKDSSTITVFLHPNNYQFVQHQKEELEQMLDGKKNIIFQIDQHLNEGDCTIKHRFGQIDVGVDVQLQQIKAALLENVLES